jgi:hypothetical protein
MMIPERARENRRKKRRHHTEEIGRPGPERDQREHVEPPIDQRRPAALEERKAAPGDHRRRQRELEPDLGPPGREAGKDQPGDHFRHRQDEQRDRQDQADPETAAHIHQFRIDVGIGRDRQWLQGHAADRAGAGAIALDLWMHGAGVGRARRRWVGYRTAAGMARATFIGQEPSRIVAKFLDAMRAAKVVGPAVMVNRTGGRAGDDGHATDRVRGGDRAVAVRMKGKECVGAFERVDQRELPRAHARDLALARVSIFIQRRDFLRSSLSQTVKNPARAASAACFWASSRRPAASTKL